VRKARGIRDMKRTRAVKPSLVRHTLTITLARLGAEPRRFKVQRGTTLREVVRAHGCDHLSVRVNRRSVAPTTRLREGDVILAVPRTIAGAAERDVERALEPYRRRLSPGDYRFLEKFVGAEALGFRQDDFYSS